jgi:hypothetical protein
MSRMPMVLFAILAVLPVITIAQPPSPPDSHFGTGDCLVPPMDYGTAMSLFVYASAFPNGDPHRLADKRCFSHEPELSGQNSMESTGPRASSTVTYSYHVGQGRLGLEAEVKASGHQRGTPEKLGGQGSGNVMLWVWWVDLFTLHSATTKPPPTQKGAPIDPSQVVEIRLRLLNDGPNQCTGGGHNFFYKTNVILSGQGTSKQAVGGQPNTDVNSNCQDTLDEGTIQALLGLGKFRVELAALITLGGEAMDADGYLETGDVKAKLGEYHFCLYPTKGPADLKITSASGIDYTCPKK